MGKKSKGPRREKKSAGLSRRCQLFVEYKEDLQRENHKMESYYPLVTSFQLRDAANGNIFFHSNLQDYDKEHVTCFSYLTNIEISAVQFSKLQLTISGVEIQQAKKTKVSEKDGSLVFFASLEERSILIEGTVRQPTPGLRQRVEQAGGSLPSFETDSFVAGSECTTYVLSKIYFSRSMVTPAIRCDLRHFEENLQLEEKNQLSQYDRIATNTGNPWELRRAASGVAQALYRFFVLRGVCEVATSFLILNPDGKDIPVMIGDGTMTSKQTWEYRFDEAETDPIEVPHPTNLRFKMSSIPFATSDSTVAVIYERDATSRLFVVSYGGAVSLHFEKHRGKVGNNGTCIRSDNNYEGIDSEGTSRLLAISLDGKMCPAIQERLALFW